MALFRFILGIITPFYLDTVFVFFVLTLVAVDGNRLFDLPCFLIAIIAFSAAPGYRDTKSLTLNLERRAMRSELYLSGGHQYVEVQFQLTKAREGCLPK